MARIALLSWGSHGDVLPFVALAQGLRAAGHEVVIAAQPYHAAFVQQQGIEFCALGSETSVEQYQQLMTTLIDEANPRKQLRLLLQTLLLPDLEAQYQDALPVVAQADVVVAHWMQLAGMAAAESLGRLCLTVSLNPVGIGVVAGTEVHEAGGQKTQERARNLGRMLSDYVWGSEFHQLRARHALPAIDSVAGYQYSSRLNLVAVSPALLPEREHFEPQHKVTGFWNLPEEHVWTPAPELAQFLAAGEPPVVFSFGSMAGHVGQMRALVIEAVRQAGCRAILQGGWAGLGQGDDGESGGEGKGLPLPAELAGRLLCVDYVPHDFLFSRATCVVHHGGAGTTASALRAGVPSVIVWHMLDQPYWGQRLASLGLGPAALARLGLKADELATRIREALNNLAYAEHCQSIAKILASERGTAAAVGEIERFLSSGKNLLKAQSV